MSELARALRTVAGGLPDIEYEPRSLDHLAELLRRNDGLTLVPVGSGTQLDLGRAPGRPFALLRLAHALEGELEHQPADLTATVPASVTLEELGRVLAARGQRLPLDPPLAPEATLGGVLAVGTGGPLRSRFGLPRDFVLGMTVMRPDGQLVKAGGRVVKNVTGYDLMRLWCGSLGTLGVIVSANLRVLPMADTEDLVVAVAGPGPGLALVRDLYRADLRPEIADLVSRDGGWFAFLRLPAPAVAAARATLALRLQSGTTFGYAWLRDAGFGERDALTVRISSPPGEIERVASQFEKLTPAGMVLRPLASLLRAWWGEGGLPPAGALEVTIARLREWLQPAAGSVIIERMPAALRTQVDPWGSPPPGFDLMRKTKLTFDPNSRLNAGRYAGGL